MTAPQQPEFVNKRKEVSLSLLGPCGHPDVCAHQSPPDLTPSLFPLPPDMRGLHSVLSREGSLGC